MIMFTSTHKKILSAVDTILDMQDMEIEDLENDFLLLSSLIEKMLERDSTTKKNLELYKKEYEAIKAAHLEKCVKVLDDEH